jgi:tyrosine-protein kinase Etk/Wzc
MVTRVSLPDMQEQVDPVPGAETLRGEGVSLLDLLILLAERKRLIFWITVAFSVASIVISLLLPLEYTATSTILPPQQNSSMGSLLSSQLAGLGGMAALAGSSVGLKSPNDMYVAMLRSRTVEDAMVQRFGLVQEFHAKRLSQARKAFEGISKVEGNGKDGLIHISVTDRDPKRASDLANGYVDQFRNLSEHLAITEAAQRRLFFEQQLEQAKNNLADAEEALKQTEQQTGLIQLDSQARALIETAATLRAQITAKEVQIQALQTFATDQNAELVQAQKELETMRTQLAKLGGTEDSGGASFFLPKGKIPEAGMAYLRKVRDVKYYETIFEILARQFETAKLDEAKQGAVVQVVDLAVPPDWRSSPHRALIVVVSTVLGLLVGVMVVFFQAGFRRLKEDREAKTKLDTLRGALTFTRHRRPSGM